MTKDNDSTLVILPTQLVPVAKLRCLGSYSTYVLWEHPHYFRGYRYNQKKLLLHRASMRSYFDNELKKFSRAKRRYVTFDDDPGLTQYEIIDPVDQINLSPKPTLIHDNPAFLLSRDDLDKYHDRGKSFRFRPFMNWCKEQTGLLIGVPSQDKLNRATMPKTLPVVASRPKAIGTKDEKYMSEAIAYVSEHFGSNPGSTGGQMLFPIRRSAALAALRHFVRHRLTYFGKYQDAIDRDSANTLYHSLLSASLNIGLILPSEVLRVIDRVSKDIPLNSYEGFVRQLFWREYQRYCYLYLSYRRLNYFGNRGRITRAWYEGTTGILPVDDCIRIGFQTGYLHHIQRLMVVGNYMNLCGISPKQGHRWFMEFSCDSYEWVMAQNVLDMVFFCSGGRTTTRPYVSSSNYVRRMSNYTRGEWCEVWDRAYRDFIRRHTKKLWKFRYYFRGLKKDS